MDHIKSSDYCSITELSPVLNHLLSKILGVNDSKQQVNLLMKLEINLFRLLNGEFLHFHVVQN
jgi:hypothetical protein